MSERMKIFIVLNGLVKNKVIEKDIDEKQLSPMLQFINQFGFYDSDTWYPTTRIKEIKFEYPASGAVNRSFMMDNVDDMSGPAG